MKRAFTIIEVVVIIVIIGVIAAVIAPRLISRIGESKQSVAKLNATTLASQLKLFMADHRALQPGDSVTLLWERPADVAEARWKPYVDNAEKLLDPWGRPFLLKIPGEKNYDFDVVSFGRDGAPGGADEDADIIAP